jgi:hypothetical protein
MINIIENQYRPTEEELDFLQHILTDKFAWFKGYDSPSETNRLPMFCHELKKRNGEINSSAYGICERIFLNFCQQNDIDVDRIFRAAINLNIHHEGVHTFIHTDHEFEHKNFIMYLSQASGDTYIFDDDENVIASIKPELYKAVVFDGLKHAAGFCKVEEYRYVLVFTFI